MLIIRQYLKIPLFTRVITAFVLGSLIGGALWYISAATGSPVSDRVVDWIAPFGMVLVSMLKMIVIPIIFFSLVTGAASLPVKKFGKLGIRVFAWYLLTSVLAAIVGAALAILINPGGGTDPAAWENLATSLMPQAENMGVQAQAGTSFMAFMGRLFQNPFHALAEGNFLSIIVFAILAGTAARVVLDKAKKKERKQIRRLLDLCHAIQEVIFKIVHWIMEYFPIGIFALSIVNFALHGADLVGPYLSIAGGVICGVIVMIFIVYPLLLFVVTHENPYAILSRMQEAVITAFVTRSSAATLPVSMEIAEEDLKVKNELASFSLPLGATINMDGVCVHLPMFAILAINMFSMQLTPWGLFVLVITTVLASIGAGGIPGGSLLLLFIILEALGLPASQISVVVALALGINPLLDMFETANNVTSDLVCTYAVAHNQDMLSKAPDK